MAEPPPDFIVCSPVSLPADRLIEAARVACEYCPTNRPMVANIPLIAPGVDMPQAIALLTTKYWGAKPRKLPTQFLESTPRPLADKILKNMNAWTKTGGIEFAGTRGTGVIRISRETAGYWSYLGTDNSLIPQDQPTMSLQGFTLDTPDSEYRRVVRHEAGHALGFPHEHMRRELVARLDPEKTIAVFLRDQGWSREMTIQQVLTPLDERSLMGTPADGTSIMAYQLDGRCTRDGIPIPGGTDLNKSDFTFCGKIYPKAKDPAGGGA